MILRTETPRDYPVLYELVKTAFQSARVSDGTEQDFVDELRAREGYLPALALVAEEGGRLIGHIMLTASRVEGERPVPLLLLAPLCVAADCRGKGVGAALVREALRRAEEQGHKAVYLVGDPAYYSRFGFVPAARFGIAYPGIPAEFVLARELVPGALRDAAGTVKG